MKNKILSLSLGRGLLVLAGLLSMCKKDRIDTKPTVQNEVRTETEKPGKVKSPDYHLSDAQNYQLIRSFQQSSGNAARDGGSADSLAVDSAQYTLEASINFDYDRAGGSDKLDIHYDLRTYSFNTSSTSHITNGYIRSTELSSIYHALQMHLDSITNDSVTVAAIDVLAYIDDMTTGAGHFEVTAVVMKAAAVPGTPSLCSTAPWTSGLVPNCSWAEVNSFLSCSSGYTTPGARARFQKEANCRDYYYGGCANGYYFPVVIMVTVSGAPGGMLYYGPQTTPTAYCTAAPAVCLTAANFNSMLANIKTYVNTFPYLPGTVFVDNSVVIIEKANIYSATNVEMYWDMTFMRGYRGCRPYPMD